MTHPLRSPARGRPTLVVVPTYNERATIAELVRRLFRAAPESVEVMVVDDGSPDGTLDVVRSLASTYPVHWMSRPSKTGLGSAYLDGFRWGRARGYTSVVQMDADLSHDPAAVPELVRALDHADVVIGSRYVGGGAVLAWGLGRRLLSRLANVYVAVWLRMGVRDATSGFRAYRMSVLGEGTLSEIGSDGYVFQVEMVRRARQSGASIVEVPIIFVERTSGESKISRRIVVEAILRVAGWGVVDLLTRAAEAARRWSGRGGG